MKHILVLIGILFSSLIVNASYDFNTRCQEAYQNILDLNFDKAKELIKQERILNPKNNIPLYLENNIDFVYLLITNDTEEYELRADQWQDRIDQLESYSENSPYYKTCLAECKLQRAVVHINQREFFYGVLDFNRAYRLLTENELEHPNFMPNKLYLGMLHTIFGAVPENYRWGIELLNFEGNISKGIEEVETVIHAANENPELFHLRYSSLLMITFLKINYQSELLPDENLINSYEQILEEHSNAMLVYGYSKFLIAQNKNEKVLNYLSQYRQKAPLKVSAIDLMHGTALVRKLDPQATQYLESFVSNYQGTNYKKQALRFIAWSALIQGDTTAYLYNMQRCINTGEAFIDQDKAALREANEKTIPNIHLLQARLLFDGGYYRKATSLLKNISLSGFTNDEKLEYTYRLARIYHQMGNMRKAIENYTLTIENGSESESYFAANSALKLGAIYEKRAQYNQAVQYYESARNMNNIEYKSSIGHKAKVGIKRIGNLKK